MPELHIHWSSLAVAIGGNQVATTVRGVGRGERVIANTCVVCVGQFPLCRAWHLLTISLPQLGFILRVRWVSDQSSMGSLAIVEALSLR